MHHQQSREALARRLQQNWLLYCNEIKTLSEGVGKDCEDDGSLTNLAWLQNISVTKLAAPLPPLSPPPSPSSGLLPSHSSLHNTLELYRQHCLNYGLSTRRSPLLSRPTHRQTNPTWRLQPQSGNKNTRPLFKRRSSLLKRMRNPVPRFQILKSLTSSPTAFTDSNSDKSPKETPRTLLTLGPVALLADSAVDATLPTIEDVAPEERMAFRTNHLLRPPFAYTTLICMSMQAMEKNKVTLDEIYNWVAENFAFYRDSEPTWKLALRQTLMRNAIFQRVPRRKEEPGGWGDVWRLHPDVRPKMRSPNYQDNPPRMLSKASKAAPKLIIQSVIKNDEEARPLPRQTVNTGSQQEPQPENHESEEHLVARSANQHSETEEEQRLLGDWWSRDLEENVEGIMGDLEEPDSDPYIPLDSPADYSIDTPKTPTEGQPWVDDRLNLEELDNILGLK